MRHQHFYLSNVEMTMMLIQLFTDDDGKKTAT
jgi:hypothetical protein